MLSSEKEGTGMLSPCNPGGSDSIGVCRGILTGFSVIECGILTKNCCPLFLLHWIFWIAYCHNVSLFLLASKHWKESLSIRFWFFSMREYIIFWHLTLKTYCQLRIFIKNFLSSCQGEHSITSWFSHGQKTIFSQSWNIRPNCTCKYRETFSLTIFLSALPNFFYFPKVITMQYFQGKLRACTRQSLLCSLVAAFAFCNFVAVF